MRAFHGDQKIKDALVFQLEAHYAADEIRKGTYWDGGKGCAIGCTVHSSNHDDYETKLGIPRVVALLESGIFSGLPNEVVKEFPLRFVKSIPVGADLSGVFPKFILWLLVDETYGVYQHASKDGKTAIKNVADLYKRRMNGENIKITEWKTAACAADKAFGDVATDDPTATCAVLTASAASSIVYDNDNDSSLLHHRISIVASYMTVSTSAASAYAYGAVNANSIHTANYAASLQKHRIFQADKLIELLAEASYE